MTKFDLSQLVRPKIYSLEPYRCARDDFKEGILLDANENTHGQIVSVSASNDKDFYNSFKNSPLNRYPDPHQLGLKQRIVNFRNSEVTNLPEDEKLVVNNICLGVGSDESIDALIRTTCRPGNDKLLICPPTYGMYKISSIINDIEYIQVPLDLQFDLEVEQVKKQLKDSANNIKLVLLTTPGNPTGKLISKSKIVDLLEWGLENWNGLIVADEAYIDFSPVGLSLSTLVNKYSNLVVFQTLLKSFGLAGIRLGITFASKELASILNALKAPYNISTLTSKIATDALSEESIKLMYETADIIKKERTKLIKRFEEEFDNFGEIIGGGLDANFILIEVLKDGVPDSKFAKQVYHKMATEKQVVVRYRGDETNCKGALRITIGTEEENKSLVENFKLVFQELLN